MGKNVFKTLLLTIFLLPVFFYLGKYNISQSAQVTNLKDQLSSAQLSYFARLGAGNVAGNSVIYINTTGTTLSITNYNLFVGDTLSIALSAGGTAVYTVSDVAGTNAIFLNTALGAGSTNPGLSVISPHSAIHTISFTPQNSITGGQWQFLIKAASTTQADNTPDTTGFDLGTLVTGAVTCPFGISAATNVGTTAIVSGNSYHVVTCALSAGVSNPIGIGASVVIGVGNSMLINPAPATNHTIGQADANADTYSIIVRHLDSGGAVLDNDTTVGKIAVTESVRVTAVIDPTITFSIGNSGVTTVGTTLCGSPIGTGAPNTTGASVSFGSLNLQSFNNLAQFIQCTTNAANGYVIQTFEDRQLTMIGGAATIPDTTCPSNSCDLNTALAWTTNTASGFGYSLEVGTTSAGATIAFASNTYKPFGVGYANARTIMSRTNTPSATDSVYICYRTTASNFQPAGTYQNEISYIATATF